MVVDLSISHVVIQKTDLYTTPRPIYIYYIIYIEKKKINPDHSNLFHTSPTSPQSSSHFPRFTPIFLISPSHLPYITPNLTNPPNSSSMSLILTSFILP